MNVLVDRGTMKLVDQFTIEKIGVPGLVLMERAALAVVEHMKEKAQKTDKILVVCGTGNNGGDGVAVARLLHLDGFQVEIFVAGELEKATQQLKQQVEIAKNVGVPFLSSASYNNYDIIVDAVFGVGLSRDIVGRYADIISSINESGAKIVAVDLPSGINADDGSVLNVAVKADMTITFGYQKVGLIRFPGNEYAGEVYVENVGFPEMAYQRGIKENEELKQQFTFDDQDIKRLLYRPQHSNKGTFGTVLVIAGSKGMSGACYLSAKAALRSGAGLVKVLTVEENRTVIQTAFPEAVVLTYSQDIMKNEFPKASYINAIETADSVIVGPGLGMSELSEYILKFTIQNVKKNLIVDADGINILAKWIDQKYPKSEIEKDGMDLEWIKKRLSMLRKLLGENTVLTPHLKEFSRLVGYDVPKINKKFIDTLEICSYNKLLIYIIKDSVTTVVQGKKRYFNSSGNDALATGGSGDVLTGIIGSFIAQGQTPYDASCLGVYVHGRTAECYCSQKYSGSMIASDIIESIGNVLK